MPEAERHRHRVGMQAEMDVGGRLERAVRRREPEDLAVPDVEPRGPSRGSLRPTSAR